MSSLLEPVSTLADVAASSSQFYRCRVASEIGKATMLIGSRSVKVIVEEASIDGFTVTMDDEFYNEARQRNVWELKFDGRHLEVQPQRMSIPDSGQFKLWLDQISDLTEPEEIRLVSWKQLFRNRVGAISRKAIVITSGFGVAGMALMLILMGKPPEIKPSEVHSNPFAGLEAEGEGPESIDRDADVESPIAQLTTLQQSATAE